MDANKKKVGHKEPRVITATDSLGKNPGFSVVLF